MAGADRRWFSGPTVLLLAMAGLLLLAPPVGEFVIDIDWNYAQVVQALVENGHLEISPWTSASLVLQMYWGALFAKLFGFSQTTLRVSTLVTGAIGVLGSYLLFRRAMDSPRALLGSLMLLFNPIYVCLAYSFMSDVPFLALAIWSQVCYQHALHGSLKERPGQPRAVHNGWLAVGSALAGGAFLIRQIGAVLPLAVIAALVLREGWRAALRPRTLLAVFGPAVPAVLLGLYIDQQRGPVRQEPVRWMLELWSVFGPAMGLVVLERLALISGTLGIFCIALVPGILVARPLLRLDRRRRLALGLLSAALAIGFAVNLLMFNGVLRFPYLGKTLSLYGFYAENYFAGPPEAAALPGPLLPILTVLSLLGLAAFALAVVLCSRETMRGPAAIPLLYGLLALGMTVPYYTLYDEYVLAFLPSVLLLVLLPFRWSRAGRAVAVLGVMLLASWSIWWERDILERQAAVWEAGRLLVERGAPPDQVDAGLPWRGWYRGQAAIARVIRRSANKEPTFRMQRQVFEALSIENPRWAVVFQLPERGRYGVLATVPYGAGHQVYAVERGAARDRE